MNIVRSFNDNMRIVYKISHAGSPISDLVKIQRLDSPFHCFLSNNFEMKSLINKKADVPRWQSLLATFSHIFMTNQQVLFLYFGKNLSNVMFFLQTREHIGLQVRLLQCLLRAEWHTSKRFVIKQIYEKLTSRFWPCYLIAHDFEHLYHGFSVLSSNIDF